MARQSLLWQSKNGINTIKIPLLGSQLGEDQPAQTGWPRLFSPQFLVLGPLGTQVAKAIRQLQSQRISRVVGQDPQALSLTEFF